MGAEKFRPIPNNIIYNFYAKCNEDDYEFVSNQPYVRATKLSNNINVNCTFTIISPEDTFQSTGSIHLIGWGSRQYKKLSWAVKLDKKFMGRKAFKLRAMANEPTLIRERLAEELYNAVGVPSQQGTYARVFINEDTYGLYTLIDSFSKKWIAGTVHGNPKAKIGTSYKLYVNGRICSNFTYLGEDYESYKKVSTYKLDEFDKTLINPEDEPSLWAPLIRFTKLYTDWLKTYQNDMSDAAITALGKFLNIESLLRLMSIETLTAAFDNFWLYSSNAALYYNPERNNYQFISYDYDQSLGDWAYDELMHYDTLVEDCYTWAHPDDTIIDHSFINSLLSHPQIKQRYDVILAKASRSTFDFETVNKFIDALAELIREDVSWNFESLDKLNIEYEGHVNHYSLEDFKNNLNYTPIQNMTTYRKDRTTFGLKDWVKKRGEGCRAYTKDVNTDNDVNISDDYNVEVYRDPSKNISSSGSTSIFSTNTTTLFILLQCILFYIYYY
ncbi:hypothetical protein PIROE2DRAFT_3205 [Piromyces sp. E2]|nr:hypothetical protein PIROE2DRAFT_3205 [Piromyces sp. E2]|eukprot:OUM68976.1 hypothetical protein PIROE2DRAFT_3205 [Piromyces sp. E2]